MEENQEFRPALVQVVDPATGEVLEVEPVHLRRFHPKGKPLDSAGREVLDPTPLAPPIGYKKVPSIFDQMRQLIHDEKIKAELHAQGVETFEEADDFDVGDDYDPTSPYEANFEPMTPQELAALSSRGRDIDRIVTPEETEALSRSSSSKRTKKKFSSADQADDQLSEELSSEDPEGA